MSKKPLLSMHANAKPELFRFADKLRNKMTPAEKIVWEFLRKKPQGLKFRRQHPFGFYILDFYCHAAKLAIEIDGKYHENIEQKILDKIRTEFIQDFGVMEIRFTNDEVLRNPKVVIEKILDYSLNRKKQEG